VGAYFGLPGSADHFVPSCARWKQFGFGSQALCFFGKTFFKGLGLFEEARQHDTISCIRVLTVGFCSSDPNMQMAARQFLFEPKFAASVHSCTFADATAASFRKAARSNLIAARLPKDGMEIGW
jgi:hypothetical protein